MFKRAAYGRAAILSTGFSSCKRILEVYAKDSAGELVSAGQVHALATVASGPSSGHLRVPQDAGWELAYLFEDMSACFVWIVERVCDCKPSETERPGFQGWLTGG